jgi:hypothetical protein
MRPLTANKTSPERREVKSLAGLPADIDPEEPVLDWAYRGAVNDEEFLVAFKISDDCFRVIRRFDSAYQHGDYRISNQDPYGNCQ